MGAVSLINPGSMHAKSEPPFDFAIRNLEVAVPTQWSHIQLYITSYDHVVRGVISQLMWRCF